MVLQLGLRHHVGDPGSVLALDGICFFGVFILCYILGQDNLRYNTLNVIFSYLPFFFYFFFLLYLVLNMTFAFPEHRSKRKSIVRYTSYK